MTLAEFERLPEPEQGGGYELDQGRLEYVSPAGARHGQTLHRLWSAMQSFVEARGLGLVLGDTFLRLGPDTVRAPDVAFYPAERVSSLDPDRFIEVVPALVAEILSPSNSPVEVIRRTHQFRAFGVSEIWVIEPVLRQADVITAESVRTLRDAAELTTPLLPGLAIPLPSLFAF